MILTSQPLRRDVLQQCERDAEEGDEQVADGQRADEDVGGGAHRAFTHHDINHQTVPHQRQRENNHVHHDKRGFGSGREFWDVDQRLDVVCVDEFLTGEVVVLQEFLESLRSDLRGGRHLCRRRHVDFQLILIT